MPMVVLTLKLERLTHCHALDCARKRSVVTVLGLTIDGANVSMCIATVTVAHNEYLKQFVRSSLGFVEAVASTLFLNSFPSPSTLVRAFPLPPFPPPILITFSLLPFAFLL